MCDGTIDNISNTTAGSDIDNGQDKNDGIDWLKKLADNG